MKIKTIIAPVIILAVIILASAFASSHPDGLEWVAEKLGFVSLAVEEPPLASPMPDYTLGVFKSPFWSTALAGLVGAAITFLVAALLAKLLRKKKG